MKRRFELPLVFLLAACVPVTAQHPEEARPANTPRANEGRIPPPPPQREAHARPAPEKRENGKINTSQHVDNNQWYGHDAPNDKRYHLDHPFEHGQFEHFGPNHRYNIVKIDL
ncbi:MAG: hypothetical protein WBQ89_12975 [Candidatus Acidiferrum sp.]